MPWQCPFCHQEAGRPVFIHAGKEQMTIDARCDACGREWTVTRQELDMRRLGPPITKPSPQE